MELLQPIPIFNLPKHGQLLHLIRGLRQTTQFQQSEFSSANVLFLRLPSPPQLNRRCLLAKAKRYPHARKGSASKLDTITTYARKLRRCNISIGQIFDLVPAPGGDGRGKPYSNMSEFFELRWWNPGPRKDPIERWVSQKYENLIERLAGGECQDYIFDLESTDDTKEFLANHFRDPLEDLIIDGDPIISGINTPWYQIGKDGTFTPFHLEEHRFSSINVCYEGAKLWFIINEEDRIKFEDCLQTAAVELRKKRCYYRKKSLFVPIETLQKWGIKFSLILQEAGDIVVTGCGCWHQVLNLSPSICASRNFILPNDADIQTAIDEVPCTCKNLKSCWHVFPQVQRLNAIVEKWMRDNPADAAIQSLIDDIHFPERTNAANNAAEPEDASNQGAMIDEIHFPETTNSANNVAETEEASIQGGSRPLKRKHVADSQSDSSDIDVDPVVPHVAPEVPRVDPPVPRPLKRKHVATGKPKGRPRKERICDGCNKELTRPEALTKHKEPSKARVGTKIKEFSHNLKTYCVYNNFVSEDSKDERRKCNGCNVILANLEDVKLHVLEEAHKKFYNRKPIILF